MSNDFDFDEKALLAELSDGARRALLQARAATGNAAMIETEKALDAVGIPGATKLTPLASEYAGEQRAVLALTAMWDLAILRRACPQYPMTRRRWIGVDAQGVLETHLVDGEPLWRVLQREGTKRLEAMPLDVALAALVEIAGTGRGYGYGVPLSPRLLARIGPAHREWAITAAARSIGDGFFTGSYVKNYIFAALARAKVPIEERWEPLFPNLGDTTLAEHVQAAGALSEPRRAAVVAKHIAPMPHSAELVAAFPTRAMVEALLGTEEPHSRRWTHYIERLNDIGDDALRALVKEVVDGAPKPIALYVASTLKPKSIDDLDATAKKQLRIAGRGYDGHDLPAKKRLEANGEETSFARFVEVRRVVDAAGKPLYDLWIYMVDSGSIFDAGTTNEMGGIAQGGVVLKTPNVPLRVALQALTLKSPPKPSKRPKPKAATPKKAAKSAPPKAKRQK
jgi:hypothetical protein